ncbi:ABC transporter ATP-binding protein [Pseudonocardia sp. Ae707_Ps2]
MVAGGRRRGVEADRPDPGVPVPDRRGGTGRDPRREPERRGDRARCGTGADDDPRRARGDAAAAGTGVRAGGEDDERLGPAGPADPRPAQRGVLGDRAGDRDHAGGGDRRGAAVVSRPRDPATGTEPGHHAVRRPAVPLPGSVVGGVPRPRDPADLPGVQPRRRRAARRPVPGGTTVSALLELRGLRVGYADSRGIVTDVLHGVDLAVGRGEKVAVVGGSGSGKSTAAAAALGLLPGTGRVTGGRILFDGEDLTTAGEARLRALRGARIGLVPQDPMSNLNPVHRVGAQIAEALTTHRLARGRAARDRAVELMAEAGIPDPARRARQYPHEFSGGMRQRVLIAMALAAEPDLLLADEPTSALDVTVQRRILDHLAGLTDARGTAMLLITHDLALAAERADRVVVMHEGHVVETGPAERILTRPDDDYTRRLVAAAPAIGGGSRAAEPPAPPRPVLEVTGLVREFRVRGSRERVRAVDDVSFTVDAGTTTALVGESGSGKTTTARIVLGLDRPTAGTVTVAGTDPFRSSRRDRAMVRRTMQPVFQDPYGSLDPTSTVARIVDEPLRVLRIGDTASRRDRVAELLDQVALPSGVTARRPDELSGGQRQRVAIARALAARPQLVVCDEAVSALDVLVQEQILELLTGLQRDLGVSLLFITHDLAVVRQVAHRVVVLRAGAVVEQGPTARVVDTPAQDYTRELLAAIPGRDVGATP